MLDLVSFDEKIKTASLVVTGEGKVDKQTVTGGKAVAGIIKHARGKIPVAVLCGSITEDARKEMIKTGVLTSAHSFIDEKTAIENANELFYYAAANMFSVLNAGNGMKKKPLRIFTKKCGNQSM